MVFQGVSFENVAEMATRNSLYLSLRFQNITHTCWRNFPKFQEKMFYRSKDVHQKPPKRVTPPPAPHRVKPAVHFTLMNLTIQALEPMLP